MPQPSKPIRFQTVCLDGLAGAQRLGTRAQSLQASYFFRPLVKRVDDARPLVDAFLLGLSRSSFLDRIPRFQHSLARTRLTFDSEIQQLAEGAFVASSRVLSEILDPILLHCTTRRG